jgi:hypothetical protein
MVPGVLVVRLDAPIYFANIQWMEDKLVEYEADALRYEAQRTGYGDLLVGLPWFCRYAHATQATSRGPLDPAALWTVWQSWV